MKAFKEFEHKADIGLEIHGHSLEELFANGLKGFYTLLFGISDFDRFENSTETYRISIQEETPEDLLVSFFSEINFLVNVKKIILFPVITIKIEKIAPGYSLFLESGLITRIPEELWDNFTEIKAPTYHGLLIKRENKLYKARVIFDV